MLIASIIIFTLLIFPIFLNVKFYISGEEKKLFFNLYLFGFINVLYGFIEYDQGFIIYLKSKRIEIPILNLYDIKNKAKPLRDYHFLKVNILLEVGSENNLIPPMAFIFIENFFMQIFEWIIKNKKPYYQFSNNTFVYEGENKFDLWANVTIVLNILMILLSFIKILMEKLINGKRQQNKGNN